MTGPDIVVGAGHNGLVAGSPPMPVPVRRWRAERPTPSGQAAYHRFGQWHAVGGAQGLTDALVQRLSSAVAGPGVPPEELATLFEPFFKRRPARAGPGSGLGLAIADHHARLLGGRLEATSRPGKTCSALVVPLVAGDGTGGRGR